MTSRSPMPPTKHPKQKPDLVQTRINELFAKNLEEIRRWYRGASGPGGELGHHVLTELILGYTLEAFTLALEGKAWNPPRSTP